MLGFGVKHGKKTEVENEFKGKIEGIEFWNLFMVYTREFDSKNVDCENLKI